MGDKNAEVRTLSNRELNRALLARQMLLKRESLSALEAIERLAGMQAQAPNAPYFGLWTRLNEFRQEELSQLVQDRTVVRIALMRSTLHLVSARDCLSMRPWVQPVLERGMRGTFGKRLEGADLEAIASESRTTVEAEPLTFSEIGDRLAARWPGADPDALAAVARTRVPLVQVPPRGLWGESGQARHTSAELWLGRALEAEAEPERMVLRYLAAFGPASVKDAQAWSGLSGLNKAFERLRPQLAVFRSEDGAALYDLPDAPRPGRDADAPPRLLGEYDNVLLSHADRSRILDEEARKRTFTANGIIRAAILLDGFVSGIWSLRRERKSAVLSMEPFRPITAAERVALRAEGVRLLAFAAPDAENREIVFAT